MIPFPSTPPRLAYYVSDAAALFSIHRTTFKRKYLDTGRIEKNDDGRVWADDLDRMQKEDIAKRQKQLQSKLRKAAA